MVHSCAWKQHASRQEDALVFVGPQVVPDVASVVGQVVAAAAGKGSSDSGFVTSPQQLQTVVVFIGSGQVRSAGRGQRSQPGQLHRPNPQLVFLHSSQRWTCGAPAA